MSIYKIELLDKLKAKEHCSLPYPLPRVTTLSISPETYTLIGSVPGVGKTSFVDETYVVKPYEHILKTGSDVKVYTVYLSMERKIKFKLARFTSRKLLMDKGIRISPKVIIGRDPLNKLTEEQIKLIESFQPWMDGLLSNVELYEGSKTVSEIQSIIENVRKRFGEFFISDNEHIYQGDKIIGTFGKNRIGDRIGMNLRYKDKVYPVYQNSSLYIPHNPKQIVQIILDHIGKTSTEGYGSVKQTLDALDKVLTKARDVYSFSPIPISQFNRSLSDITRLKYSKGNLEPIYEDFKDTGNLVESADVILSLFNPYKYQSYDSKGNYKGYNLTNGLLAPTGAQRFRSLHILKDSNDSENITFGLRFTGEAMHFTTLPRADNFTDLQKVYADIARGN